MARSNPFATSCGGASRLSDLQKERIGHPLLTVFVLAPFQVFTYSMGDLFSGADPLVRAGRPPPPLLSKNQALAAIDKPARGPALEFPHFSAIFLPCEH